MVKKRELASEIQLRQWSYPPVGKAIILAAGVGNRLSPFTDRLPKCLVQVNDIPILVNTLTHLADSGIDEAVIVVGHLKEMIVESIGTCFRGMSITYVESDCYTVTNNIYSLWLAREHLTEDVLLLEADVYFEREVIDRLLHGRGENRAAVARHQSWMSGTVVSLDKEGNIQALLETSHQGPQFDYSKVFKTLNMYLFRRDYLRDQFVPRLEAFINAGEVNQYYEVILQTTTYSQRHRIGSLLCDDIKWFEIDDENDRLTAEYIFASPDE
ncbi:MAG: phosphocholine cytidylyltransferase family protein, partial [Dehalococcoidales bacterium]|nr:phosphocholine cytidylyltransferase family protein [Dehalococcoidales bacterium]